MIHQIISTSQSSFETAGKFHSNLSLSHANYKAGVTKESVEQGEETTSSTLTSSNININGSALINSSDEFALLASNLIASGSIEINSKNNLNISDGKNTITFEVTNLNGMSIVVPKIYLSLKTRDILGGEATGVRHLDFEEYNKFVLSKAFLNKDFI